MTNLYETLGVNRDASPEEIMRVYAELESIYSPLAVKDMNIKIMFDDIKMSYNTLIDPKSRAEYDEYMSSHISMANY